MSAVYPSALDAIAGPMNLTTVAAKWLLLEGYTYSAAHDFLNDVPGGVRVGTAAAVTLTVGGGGKVFGAFTDSPAPPAGHTCGSFVIYEDTGAEATSHLICLVDTRGAGTTPLEVATDGTDVGVDYLGLPVFTI